jgi:NAD-dependent SIR2 family protein deacetylase
MQLPGNKYPLKFFFKGKCDNMKNWKPTPVTVTCTHCGEEFDENKIELRDISSDDLGRDIVLFDCPECKKLTQSLRRG